MALLHESTCVLACWDHMWPVWQSDRASPAGIIVLDRHGNYGKQLPPIPYGQPIPDDQVATGKKSATIPPVAQPFFLMEWMGSHQCLLKKGSHASPTLGHVAPLIPAPDWLLNGVQHPAYTMRPTMWIPFAPSIENDHFVTPYLSGWFNTARAKCKLDIGAPSADRPLQWEGAHEGALEGTVHFGSVVAYWEQPSQELEPVEKQGVVVLTGVRMSEAYARPIQEHVKQQPVLKEMFAHRIPQPFVLVIHSPRSVDDSW